MAGPDAHEALRAWRRYVTHGSTLPQHSPDSAAAQVMHALRQHALSRAFEPRTLDEAYALDYDFDPGRHPRDDEGRVARVPRRPGIRGHFREPRTSHRRASGRAISRYCSHGPGDPFGGGAAGTSPKGSPDCTGRSHGSSGTSGGATDAFQRRYASPSAGASPAR